MALHVLAHAVETAAKRKDKARSGLRWDMVSEDIASGCAGHVSNGSVPSGRLHAEIQRPVQWHSFEYVRL